MGYDIYIGNTEMELIEQYEDEDEFVTPYSRIIDGKVCYFKPVVRKEVRQPDAPTFPNDDLTGKGNSRHPSYVGWTEFCKKAGLYDLFFNCKTGLMREHPGHVSLEVQHAQVIEEALAKWRKDHPCARPGFDVPYPWQEGYGVPSGNDPILARLIWLDWWVQWALKNCEHAAIYNF